jgi:hypothetical protein
MTVVEFLTDLQRQGFSLIPLPEGRLAVRPADRLTDVFREQIRQRKAEVLDLLTRPYLTDEGELRIPCAAAPRYRWWDRGQSIAETLQELNAPAEVWRRYVAGYTETVQ